MNIQAIFLQYLVSIMASDDARLYLLAVPLLLVALWDTVSVKNETLKINKANS